MTNKVLQIVQEEFERRLLEESFSRIKKCSLELSEEEFWRKPNRNSNSVGNLVLHLTGNIKQYINTGIGGEEDIRQRDEEFDEANKVKKDIAVSRLKEVLLSAKTIVDKLSMEVLSEQRKVQGFEESVLSIIIHVIEHMSYHVGQITYYTKLIKDIDTRYYAGLDLNSKS